jgi:hypothetical protein
VNTASALAYIRVGTDRDPSTLEAGLAGNDFDALDGEVLAEDAIRLLERETADAAAEHTRRAARSVRRIVERQLLDADRAEALADFDVAATGQHQDALAAEIAACARDDPDFARRLLAAINSDVLVDPTSVAPSSAAPALAVPPVARLVAGVVAMIVGIVLRDRYQPEATFCGYGLGDSDQTCTAASIMAAGSLLSILAGALLAAEAIWRLARTRR